jgi:endonuclease/exonuclease/phosphatase family metal-dependent hydrolase
MPRFLLCCAVFIASLLAVSPSKAQPDSAGPLRVLSFNIRFDNPADSLNAWPYRKEAVAGVMRFYGADLVGLQEAQRGQLADLEALLPGFAWFGLPRVDAGPRDEYTAVLYRTDRLEVLDHNTFWLSETPDVPAIRGWDAAHPRIVTWGRFRDRASGDTLYLFNTHFDHVGVEARVESARLLGREIDRIAGEGPVVVTGDFNAPPDSEPIRIMTQHGLADARTVSAEPPYGPDSTWNGFVAVTPGRRIDYIFVRGDGVSVRRYATLAETYDGVRFPSDHLPVLADVVVE